jgi:hypothetical protein
MSKLYRTLFFFCVFGLIAPALSVQKANAKSIADWNYFKDHPCNGAQISEWAQGLEFNCGGAFGVPAMIAVPLIHAVDQLPENIFVYSLTGMQFDWAPFMADYYKNGHLDTFQVSDKEYYADIDIHPYLYQIKQTTVASSIDPILTNIGNNTTIQLGEPYTFRDYYTTTVGGNKIGIAFGGPENINDFRLLSIPQLTDPPTGPGINTIKDWISQSFSFGMNNKSGSPTSTYPYFDFDDLHGAWVLSTISSAFGTVEWDGNPAFRLNIEYMVEMRAWAEARQHFKWETRMVKPAEMGWVCVGSGYPPFIGCRTSSGGWGYWSWEVIKQAEYKEGWWAYPINPSSDWGGFNDGAFRVPTSDSAINCNGCRQKITSFMAPDLSRVLPYSPFLVYESHPLPDKPW